MQFFLEQVLNGINIAYLSQLLAVIPGEGARIVSSTSEAYKKIGATPCVNSVIGARMDRESPQSTLCAAITGLVPEYGGIVAAG